MDDPVDARLEKILGTGKSQRCEAAGRKARFRVGETVVTTNDHPGTHTRLPRYAMGRRGIVAMNHGVFRFPDSRDRGEGDCPQHCYAVRFESRELWGRDGHRRDAVILDVWEACLRAP